VANVFQNSEFGVVEEFGDDKFVNRFGVIEKIQSD